MNFRPSGNVRCGTDARLQCPTDNPGWRKRAEGKPAQGIKMKPPLNLKSLIMVGLIGFASLDVI
jgi:hypothetical protein